MIREANKTTHTGTISGSTTLPISDGHLDMNRDC